MAINWYVRRLLLQELDLGTKAADIARRSGLTPAQISHIKKDARSAGMLAVIKLSRPIFRRSEGQVIDEALAFWEKQGRREWAEEKMRNAVAAKRQVEDAMKRQPSGERPSVKLRAGLPIPSPPPVAKKK